jgi:hypothetical protein
VTDPLLRVRSSGQGGSGYKIPTDGGRVVPGVTTVTGIADKPGLRQWAVDLTAAYAVTHVDALLNRSEVEGYGFLRYRWKREPKLDADPNLRNWHEYVLNDAADMGTWFHEYAEADLTDGFTAEPVEDWQQEMVDAWNLFKFEHDIEVLLVEETVYNPIGYAGTFDLLVRIDGKVYLVDIKTSRGTWPEHLMQLAALGAAPVWLRQVDSEHPGAVIYKRKDKPDTWWVEDVIPDFAGYAIIHCRPTDDDGTPPFCELKMQDWNLIDLHYDWFLGHLTAKQAEIRVKEHNKGKEAE